MSVRHPLSALSLLVAGCVACGSAAAVPAGAPAKPGGPAHVVVIVMENHEYDSILGPGSDATYLRSLAARYVTLTNLFATDHPSLPNYLALTSGSTHGITSDCTDCLVDSQNIVDQLQGASLSWKAYMESIPSTCYKGPHDGTYYMKHDPFMYYTDIRNDAKRCRRVVALTQLTHDLAAHALPTFAFITPNICHDMHDCSVTIGDRFLHAWVPRILPALGANGILIVLFDEGDTGAGCCNGVAAGGHIAGVIAGPGAARRTTVSSEVDQYSVLRLIEEAFGLAPLGAAATAPRITGWQR